MKDLTSEIGHFSSVAKDTVRDARGQKESVMNDAGR